MFEKEEILRFWCVRNLIKISLRKAINLWFSTNITRILQCISISLKQEQSCKCKTELPEELKTYVEAALCDPFWTTGNINQIISVTGYFCKEIFCKGT